MIYFVQDDQTLAIKIGHTAGEPEGRIKGLQTGCPGTLTLLGVVAGGLDAESELHERFEADRIRGEWFRPSPALLTFLISFVRDKRELAPPRAVAELGACSSPSVERPVRYCDVIFSNEREARWAAWFDALGCSRQYKPPSAPLIPGAPALFWLPYREQCPHPHGKPPEQGYWVLAVPYNPRELHTEQLLDIAIYDSAARLSADTRHCCYVLGGCPLPQQYVYWKFGPRHRPPRWGASSRWLSTARDGYSGDFPAANGFEHYITVFCSPHECCFAFQPERLRHYYGRAQDAILEALP